MINNFNKLTKTTNFYFIRHGESQANQKNLIGGGKHHDPKLTERGELQASYLGSFFKERRINLDLIYTSTLIRAITTSDILADAISFKDEIIKSEDLIEIETGDFTDYTYSEISTQFPDIWNKFKKDVWDIVPNAESLQNVKDRVSNTFDNILQIAEKEDKRNVAIICHWGVLQAITKLIFVSESWKPLVHFPNCSITNLIIAPFEKEFDGRDEINGPPYSMLNYIAKLPYPQNLSTR